jgi:hypothetical protein
MKKSEDTHGFIPVLKVGFNGCLDSLFPQLGANVS